MDWEHQNRFLFGLYCVMLTASSAKPLVLSDHNSSAEVNYINVLNNMLHSLYFYSYIQCSGMFTRRVIFPVS